MRYAHHLDNDPLRKASERIANELATAMGESVSLTAGKIIHLRKPGKMSRAVK